MGEALYFYETVYSPRADLCSPKRAWVWAGLTCNPAQDEWAALGEWHLQQNTIKSSSWGRLVDFIAMLLLLSLQGVYNTLVWLSLDNNLWRQRWATERFPKNKPDDRDQVAQLTLWHDGVRAPLSCSWGAWVRSLRESREKGFGCLIQRSEKPNDSERNSPSSFTEELKGSLLT